MMTRKDYKLFAEMIRNLKNSENHDALDNGLGLYGYNRAIEDMASELVKLFADDNSNFDSDRFLKACGL